MLKIVGSILIVVGAGGFGIGKALRFYRQLRQLNELLHALELLKCEMNYTLLPIAELCKITSERVGGTAGELLLSYANALADDLTRTKAIQTAMEQTHGLCLSSDAQMALLELFGNLGRYDLEGENRLLTMTQNRLKNTLEECESEKKPLAKGYAALGICMGIALAILLI